MDSPPSNDAPSDVSAPSTPAEGAPSVTAIVVTHDAGPWFEQSLEALANQDYPNLSVLVVDTASAEDPTARVHAVLPDAAVHRLEGNDGYAPSTNAVLSREDLGAFVLLCHDDLKPEPEAVRLLVEEAFRSNGGVLGPKVVDWNEPSRLLEVGMSVDKSGAPAPLVDRGELDQEQHDGVRDVFYVSGGCTLVRTDLFRALGGFDSGIDYLGEDLDLCWRAHVAGARVLVVPESRVGHIEALGDRRPVDDRRRLQQRHRVRTMLSCYSPFHLLRVVPQALLIAVVEAVYAVLIGNRGQARDILGAWTWNLRRSGEIRSRRKVVKATRQVKDPEVRNLQVAGSARFSAFVRGQIGSDDTRLRGVTGVGRSVTIRLREPEVQWALAVWVVALFVLALGSRELITDGIPAVGEFVPYPDAVGDLTSEFSSAFRDAGLGSDAPAPTGLGVSGILGYLFLGQLGLLRTALIVGMLPVGLLGMWRLTLPFGSRRARIVATVAYAAVPVGYNAIGNAHWSGVVAYAVTPWIVSSLARLSRAAPFGALGGDAGPAVRDRGLLQRVIALGVVLAFASFLIPVVLLAAPLMAIAIVLGGLVVGRTYGAARMVGGSIGAVVVALALQLPWSLDFTSGWDVFGRPRQSLFDVPGMSEILRFETGDLGAGVLGWALLVAATLPLLIAREWRLGWAVRGWFLALGSWFLALSVTQGWLPVQAPPVEVVLAPGAVGIALAVGLGMAAFEADLPDYHFGWRQVASVVAGGALVLALLPVVLDAATDGRWGTPSRDLTTTLSFLSEDQTDGAFRVLWLGDPDVVPMSGWVYDDGMAYATTSQGLPRTRDVYPGDSGGENDRIRDALDAAATGETTRLGAELAPLGVRYVVVPLRLDPAGSEQRIPPSELLASLPQQLDLAEIEVSSAVRVWESAVWESSRIAVLGEGDPTPVLTDVRDFASYEGPIPPSEVVVASGGSGWRLQVDGEGYDRTDFDEWASAFDVADEGDGRLGYDSGSSRTIVLLVVAAAWLLAFVLLLRARVDMGAE